MTPEREREIRKIAGRDGQTWRSSAVSLVALNGLLDELDRLRGAAEGLRTFLDEKAAKAGADGDANSDIDAKTGYLMRGIAYVDAKQQGRELGLWE